MTRTEVIGELASEIGKMWDRKACVWATGNLIEHNHVRLIRREIDSIVISLPVNAQILELASGSNNTKYYPPDFDFCRLVAVDISEKMLRYLGFKNPCIRNKIIADSRANLPFINNSFDASFCFFGMRYILNQEDVLNELIRVTKPNGCIGIADYDNYLYEGAVRIFDPCLLQGAVLGGTLSTTVRRLAEPFLEGNPTLYFLKVVKKESNYGKNI